MKNTDIEGVRAFNRVYTVFIGILNRRYLKSKFTLVETRVMHAAYVKPGILPSEIVIALNIDKGYLSRLITGLEKRKIIAKEKSSNDGRSVKLYITETGKKEFEKLTAASNDQVKDLLSHFNEKNRKKIVENMNEIRKILEKQSSKK